jgi:hypothetical protein
MADGIVCGESRQAERLIMANPGLVTRWVALCAVAEFLGIASAAIWYGGVNVVLGEPEPLLARTMVWFLMSLAAVPEGIVLGGLQAAGIRWFLPNVSARKWILATIGVGLLGWAIGSFIPLFMAPEAGSQPMAEPGLAGTAAFAAVFGVGVGAVFGLGQTWALPPKTGGRWFWIVANAAGWAVGLPLIYVAAQIASEYQGWTARILIWAMGGLGAGVSIGIATGIALALIGRDRAQERGQPS